MSNLYHKELLERIVQRSRKPTQHTFSDSYLGNKHARYPISAPQLRLIANEWMKDHRDLPASDLAMLLTRLIEGESSTEKMFAGILLDSSKKEQRNFDPHLFEQWLDHLEGWAEVDSVCTGKYQISHIPLRWTEWDKILSRLASDDNINKRRASLVLLCSVVGHSNDKRIVARGLKNILKLMTEKSVLITKAVSWLLRSMVKLHKAEVSEFIKEHHDELPKIAVRETLVKLKTGKKTKLPSK